MRIYLVQHGACLEKSVNPEQPLSEEGEQAVNSLCRFLSSFNLGVASIIPVNSLTWLFLICQIRRLEDACC